MQRPLKCYLHKFSDYKCSECSQNLQETFSRKKTREKRAYTVKKRRLEETKGNTSKMEEAKEKAKSQEEKLIE